MGLTDFREEERVGNSQNMSKISSGSIINPTTQPITINSTGAVITYGSNT